MSPDHPQWEEYKVLKQEAIQAAINKIQAMERGEKQAILQAVIADYRAMEHELLNDRVWSRRKREFTSESMELGSKRFRRSETKFRACSKKGRLISVGEPPENGINYREANLYESQA